MNNRDERIGAALVQCVNALREAIRGAGDFAGRWSVEADVDVAVRVEISGMRLQDAAPHEVTRFRITSEPLA